MAQVPVYGGTQVRSNGLQPVQQQQVDVSSGLRAVGAGLAQVGEAVDKVAQRQIETEAWDAQAGIASEFEKWDRETRKTAQGSNAAGLTAKTDEWWAKTRDERFSKLSGPAQAAAGRALSNARLAALRSAGTYEDQQLDLGERQALASRIVTGTSAAAAAGAGRADPLIGDLVGEIREFGKRKGMDVEGQILQTTTGIHANIINGLVRNKDIKGAEEYFTSKKGEIDGARHDEIAKGLVAGSSLLKSQSFADEVVAKKMTMEGALAEARTRFDGDEEVAAVNEIKVRFAEVDTVRARATNEVTKTAWKQFIEGGGSISRIDPVVYKDLMNLAPEEKRQMSDWAEAKQRQAKADREGVPDGDEQGRYYTYVRMALDNPSKFASFPLETITPFVSKAQWNSLVSMQSGIDKGQAKAMESQRQIKSTLDMVKGSILSAGIDLSPKEGSKQATEYNNFMGRLTTALTEAQAAQPDKPLTPEQLKVIGMSMLKQGYEQGSGFLGFGVNQVPGYKQDPGKNYVEIRYGEIPTSVRGSLEKEYDAKNRGAGIYGSAADREAAIERAYQRGREQGRFK